MNSYKIKYQYGSYSGTHEIMAEDEEQAIAKMWAYFRRMGYLTLSMAYTHAEVISCEVA